MVRHEIGVATQEKASRWCMRLVWLLKEKHQGGA